MRQHAECSYIASREREREPGIKREASNELGYLSIHTASARHGAGVFRADPRREQCDNLSLSLLPFFYKMQLYINDFILKLHVLSVSVEQERRAHRRPEERRG